MTDFSDFVILAKTMEDLPNNARKQTCLVRCNFNDDLMIAEIPEDEIPSEDDEAAFFLKLVRMHFDTNYQYFEDESPEQESPSEV
jgi:hypothetical protein